MNSQISTFRPEHSRRFSANAYPENATSIDDLFLLVAQSDDYQAFGKIFDKSFKSLCNFARRFVKSPEIAEEIVDDVFFNCWKNRRAINITSSFTAYLMIAVRNKALDSLRKAKSSRDVVVSKVPDQICSSSIPSEVMVLDELNRCMDNAIQQLAPQCRRIFLMSRNEELTYRQIAEKLNLSVKTVDTQMGRALKHLRQQLQGSEL